MQFDLVGHRSVCMRIFKGKKDDVCRQGCMIAQLLQCQLDTRVDGFSTRALYTTAIFLQESTIDNNRLIVLIKIIID
jgi:hypothetical protein